MSKIPRQRRTLIEALEPRLLFSATADIAVFDDGNSDVQYLSQAAAEVDLVSIYLPPLAATAADATTGSDTRSDEPLALAPIPENSPQITTLVFIDRAVDGYELLVEDIRQQNSSGTIELVYINPERDGIAQMSETLARYSGVAAVHIISHGSAGSVALGNALLSSSNLGLYESQLSSWRTSLSDEADILFYGCDIAANSAGQQLIAQLAALTHADVAASNDFTGHQSLQGDWELEYSVGAIESSTLVSAAAQQSWVNVMASSYYINIQGGSNAQSVSSASGVGQSFLYDSPGATYTVNQLSVQLRLESGAANQDITIQLLDEGWNDASPLATQTFNSNQLDSTFGWQTVSFGDVTLNDNQTYIVKITTNNADGKVSVAYRSDAWNGSEMIVNGTGNSSNDLNFVVSYNDGSNQAPVNTVPGAQTTNQNTALVFSAANLNQIQVADADAFPQRYRSDP